MFWRTFLISFVLNHREYFQTSLHNSNIIEEYLPKQPIKIASPDSSANIKRLQMNPHVNESFFAGYDMRRGPFRNETLDNMVIMNITRFRKQMDLLCYLENNGTSEIDKLTAIEDYNRMNYPNQFKPNLKSGGLLGEWSDVIS
uniref:Uncharacterized protein n=1 Tax=viral metagenome TaxID=1070528 RepID=A0A6C0D3I5_9ZZZZ